jgi:DNA-nicking Smr family endonuclease
MADGEIDLHGLTVAEGLSRFAAHYNARLRAGDAGAIRVVHGYGSSGRGGDLRAAVREMLSRHAGRLEFVPGETFFDNPGVTLVYPKHPLPPPSPIPPRGRRR